MSADLPATEHEHPQTARLDVVSTGELVALLIADQQRAADVVAANAAKIAGVIERTVERLRGGGRLHYVGAGTSGRLGVLDAAELYPTFRAGEELVAAHIAGGAAALTHAIEGAEDDRAGGERVVRDCVAAGDAVYGISAGGTAPFVIGAVAAATAAGAYTVAIVNAGDSPLADVANETIELATGPEALTGSTRLKAGTSQKIVLNTLSTAIMVRLGKVFGNKMVDVVVANRKLRERAIRLIASIAEVDRDRAIGALERCDGRVKIAIVCERRGVDPVAAAQLLERTGGMLRPLL